MLILPEKKDIIYVMPLPKDATILDEMLTYMSDVMINQKGLSKSDADYLVSSLKEFLSARVNSSYYELLPEESKQEIWIGIDMVNSTDEEMHLQWYNNLVNYIQENPRLVDNKSLLKKIKENIVDDFTQFLKEKGAKKNESKS